MVASTLLVQADLSGTTFGGAFVPTDVTRFVRLVDGVNINSWRQDAASQISPSTLSLTFDNDALPGDATAPNAGRFTPGLSTSPWSGRILPGVRIRVSETVGGTTYQLFDGYVLDWTAQPGGDDGTFPVVVVSCTDALGWMAQLQPLYSILIEEMLPDAPAALYRLDEPAGATSAGDMTGSSARPATMTVSQFGAGAFAFGAETDVFDAAGAISMSSPDYNSGTSTARATYLTVPNVLPARAASGPFSLEMWLLGPSSVPSIDNPTAIGQRSLTPGFEAWSLSISRPAGALFWSLFPFVQGATSVCDGKWHHVVLTLGADNRTMSLYVDGVLDGSAVAGTSLAGLWNNGLDFTVGASDFTIWLQDVWNGSFAVIAQYSSTLSAARVAAHHTAGVNAFAGERTDQHAARLLGYRPNTGSLLDVGKGIIGAHATSGLSMTQALLDTGKAEGGLVFADGQGRIVLLNRAHLYDPVASATFDSEADLTSDYQARIDTQLLVNDMTVSRPLGASQRAIDTPSKSTYGWRQQSDTYVINSDRDADDAAGWLVANQKTTAVRTPSIALDIATMASTSQAQAAMARQPLDRVALSNLPAWAPPTDVLVQGRSVRIDDKGLSVGFFTSPLSRKTLRADAAASANTKLDNGLVISW